MSKNADKKAEENAKKFGQLTKKMTVNDIAICGKVALYYFNSKTISTNVGKNSTFLPLHKKLIKLFLQYKAPVIKNIIKTFLTQRDPISDPNPNPNPNRTRSKNRIDDKFIEFSQTLYQEEIKFVMRYYVYFKTVPNVNKKCPYFDARMNKLLQHMIKYNFDVGSIKKMNLF